MSFAILTFLFFVFRVGESVNVIWFCTIRTQDFPFGGSLRALNLG